MNFDWKNGPPLPEMPPSPLLFDFVQAEVIRPDAPGVASIRLPMSISFPRRSACRIRKNEQGARRPGMSLDGAPASPRPAAISSVTPPRRPQEIRRDRRGKQDFKNFQVRLKPARVWREARGIAAYDVFSKSPEITDHGAKAYHPDKQGHGRRIGAVNAGIICGVSPIQFGG